MVVSKVDTLSSYDESKRVTPHPDVLGLVEANRRSSGSSEVSRAVLDLVGITKQLPDNPKNVESIYSLIGRLKHLLLQERQSYAFMRQNSESRKMLESLHNLIQYLEAQVERILQATQRHGLRYYLATISNKVRGNEVDRISRSMESELQLWLDQQNVRELPNVISKGSEDAQVEAISSFERIVQKGYNALLQEAILSIGLVEKLSALLVPDAASWRVAKAAAFALFMLLDFNKDIFVSLVLMAKMVENIVGLMEIESDEHVLVLVCVINNMLSVGHTIMVDEIYAQNGVPKVVQLLDHKFPALQHAAMDCVFELAYYGRIEVVEKMFQLQVVEKLAFLQQSYTKAAVDNGLDSECEKPITKQDKDASSPEDLFYKFPSPSSAGINGAASNHPFANAVTKFALHLSLGTGLRKREKRALKQEFLRQIRQVMEDDTEVANITAEVLWAP